MSGIAHQDIYTGGIQLKGPLKCNMAKSGQPKQHKRVEYLRFADVVRHFFTNHNNLFSFSYEKNEQKNEQKISGAKRKWRTKSWWYGA